MQIQQSEYSDKVKWYPEIQSDVLGMENGNVIRRPHVCSELLGQENSNYIFFLTCCNQTHCNGIQMLNYFPTCLLLNKK